MKRLFLFSLLTSGILLASEAKQIHIVSTTDLHGYLQAKKTDANLDIGGVDTMLGFFNIAKQADPETLFLDSGDMFQGTIISNSSDGAPVVRWMDHVGYLAAAIGNHEFDFGPGNGFISVQKPGQDPVGALKARVAQAKFKFLAANICEPAHDPAQCKNPENFQPASFTKSYLLKTIHGIKLGIIGLSTLETPDKTLSSNVTHLKFMPLAKTVERFASELRKQGVKYIVVIIHDGEAAIKKMLDQLSPETRAMIPVILGGHTHEHANTTHKGVQILITGNYGEAFGYTTLELDKKLKTKSSQTIYFCHQVFSSTQSCIDGSGAIQPAQFLGKIVKPDSSASGILKEDIAKAEAVSSKVVGRLASSLFRTETSGESSLGNFMADAFRMCKDSACKEHADIAFLNNGAIRSASIKAGPVNYGQIFEVMPFDNVHVELMLSGKQIHDLLTLWYYHREDIRNPQMSGLQVTYLLNPKKPRVLRNETGESKVLLDPIKSIQFSNGNVFEESKTYRVVLNNFLASGGGGTAFILNSLKPKPKFFYNRKLRDQLVDYFALKPDGWDYGNVKPRIYYQ